MAGVEQRLLVEEPIFIGVSVRHSLAARKETGLADLAGEQRVIPDADDSGMNTSIAHAYPASPSSGKSRSTATGGAAFAVP
jgi:hypothetical protein